MIYMPLQASILPAAARRGMASVLQDASFAAPSYFALRGVDVVVVPSSTAQQHNLSAAASARELRPHAPSNLNCPSRVA